MKAKFWNEQKQPGTKLIWITEKREKWVRGRWLMNGQAGKILSEKIKKAEHSIVILSRAFSTKKNSLSQKMAHQLINQAKSGVEVTILLPRDFIPYFDQMNKQTLKYFKNTPVKIQLVATKGYFNPTRSFSEFHGNPNFSRYVDSAVVLIDGTTLLVGNYLMTGEDLMSDNSTKAIFRGPGVYYESYPYLKVLLRQHGVDYSIPDTIPISVQKRPSKHWHRVHSFSFHIGQSNSPSILGEVLDRADTSVTLFSWNPGNLRNNRRLQNVLSPVWSKQESSFNAKLFYSDCAQISCLVSHWMDQGYKAYRIQEPENQYQRFGIIDQQWFYTGTIDLNELRLIGRKYETFVTGRSDTMVKQIKGWMKDHQTRAKPIHKSINRFPLIRENEEMNNLAPTQTSAVHFLRDRIIPAIKTKKFSNLIRFMNDTTAEVVTSNLLWRFQTELRRNNNFDSGPLRKFITNNELDLDHLNYDHLPTDKHGRDLLILLNKNVISSHSNYRSVLNDYIFDYFATLLYQKGRPQLVQRGKTIRVYQPEITPFYGGYNGTLWLLRRGNDWKIKFR